MKTVAFRVDGGQNVGMGHIMRCLSLAKAFKDKEYTVYFISKIEQGIKEIKEKGFEVFHLSYKEEVQEVITIIKEYNIEILFIDTYNITKKYFLDIKPSVKKLVYIDDINKFIYPVDILINGNITAKHMNYVKYLENEVMLLGPKYNLIRDEFRNLPKKKTRKKIGEVMITTGGSDPYNMASKLLKILLYSEKTKDLRFNVIVGGGFENKTELRNLKRINNNIILYENIKKISEVMLRSDVAISSGGSTLYELCACGTPTLAFIYADNQEFIVNQMDKEGYVKKIGWFDQITKEDLIRQVLNEKKLNEIKNKAKNLIDGYGASRVVETIRTL